jgi:hypothetical protein
MRKRDINKWKGKKRMGYGKEEEKEMQDFAPLLSFHIQ